MTMRLRLLTGTYSWASLTPDSSVDAAAFRGCEFWFVSGDKTEVTVVCQSGLEPESQSVSDGWRIFEVTGKLTHDLTGITASIAAPLAVAGIQIMPIANYRTDYIGVNGEMIHAAIGALQQAGFETVASPATIAELATTHSDSAQLLREIDSETDEPGALA